jgi:hypothetical protein
MTSFLDIALDHVARGWHVFPCRPKTKKPLIDGGEKWVNATNDVVRVRAWWTKWPDANVAIAGNGSQIAVLDVDHGLQDRAAWSAWRERNGIPETYTVRTGRRPEFGAQMYFAGSMDDVGDFQLDGCRGQVKSVGGYVMAADCIHPDSGERYEVLCDAPLAPLPDLVRRLKKPAVVQPNNSKVLQTAWNLPVYAGQNRTGFLMEQTGAMRNLGCGKDAILARMVELNDDPEIIAEPVDEARLESTAANCAKFPVPAPLPVVTIGGKKGAVDVEEVEELDQALRAAPLPAYPVDVFADTLYMDFAKRAADGNYVPLEFFIEGAMTYAGAMAADNLRGFSDEITPRMYTVLLALAGLGKGTTFRRLRKLAPPHRMLDAVTDSNVPHTAASVALLASAGSEPGLNDALLAWKCVCLDFEEMDRLMEKTRIDNSGGALMSVIRTLFDDIHPGITTTGKRTIVAPVGYLSLLGAMTPSLWRQAMEGRDSYGSGLGGRFNLVATNVSESAASLTPMDIGDLQSTLDRKLADLEHNALTIPTDKPALDVLTDWWQQSKGQPHYNRVNVILHRKALHLAWLRGLPVITKEVMLQALRLGDYLVAVRHAFSPTKGEDRTAIGENRVLHILSQIAPKAVSSKRVVELLDGLMSRASVQRALDSLVSSGEAEKVEVKREGQRRYAVFRCLLKTKTPGTPTHIHTHNTHG